MTTSTLEMGTAPVSYPKKKKQFKPAKKYWNKIHKNVRDPTTEISRELKDANDSKKQTITPNPTIASEDSQKKVEGPITASDNNGNGGDDFKPEGDQSRLEQVTFYRFVITDGRVLMGTFAYPNQFAQLILHSCTEFIRGKQPRLLGTVVFPSSHIVSMSICVKTIRVQEKKTD